MMKIYHWNEKRALLFHSLKERDVMDCGAYKKLKLLEHAMKTVKRELQNST